MDFSILCFSCRHYSQLFLLDISKLYLHRIFTGRHKPLALDDYVDLASGSQVKIFRMNFKNISFSLPGAIVFINSSKDVLWIGGSDIQLSIVINYELYFHVVFQIRNRS